MKSRALGRVLACWSSLAVWPGLVSCGADGEGRIPPVTLDPGIADASPWERACVAWIRTGCAKATACGVPASADCARTDAVILKSCRQDAERERCGGRTDRVHRPSPHPDAESFESCRKRDETRSCRDFCPDGPGGCFNFCFFKCVPGEPAYAEGTVISDEATGLTRLELPVNRMVADRARRRLYATVSGRSVLAPNAVVVIDATNLKVLQSVALGAAPGALTLSVDGSKLWIGLDGAEAIRAVTVSGPDLVPGEQHRLPQIGSFPTRRVRSLVALPDSPDTVAVAMESPENFAILGTVVLDGGVPRPRRLEGVAERAGQLVRGPDGWIFGYNNQNTGFDFVVMTVGQEGIAGTVPKRGLLWGFDNEIAYAGGRIYARNGEILDVTDPSSPKSLAKFAFTGLPSVDEPTRSAVLLTHDAYDLVFRLMDIDGFGQKASFQLPWYGESRSWDFDRLDADSFIFVGGALPTDRSEIRKEGRGVYLVTNAGKQFKPTTARAVTAAPPHIRLQPGE